MDSEVKITTRSHIWFHSFHLSPFYLSNVLYGFIKIFNKTFAERSGVAQLESIFILLKPQSYIRYQFHSEMYIPMYIHQLKFFGTMLPILA